MRANPVHTCYGEWRKYGKFKTEFSLLLCSRRKFNSTLHNKSDFAEPKSIPRSYPFCSLFFNSSPGRSIMQVFNLFSLLKLFNFSNTTVVHPAWNPVADKSPKWSATASYEKAKSRRQENHFNLTQCPEGALGPIAWDACAINAPDVVCVFIFSHLYKFHRDMECAAAAFNRHKLS